MKQYKLFNDLPESEMLQYILYDDHYTVWMNQFMSSINGRYKSENWHFPTDIQSLDLTLSYLHPLIEKGELKVFVSDLEKESITDEEREKDPFLYSNAPCKRVLKNVIEYWGGQADEALVDIKKRWENTPEDERTYFKQFAILFTLPENSFY